MNILVVPSWYPTTKEPLKATFCKENPIALASELKEHTIYISNWHENQYKFQIRNLLRGILNLLSYVFSSKKFEMIEFQKNLFEIRKANLSWSSKMKKWSYAEYLTQYHINLIEFLLNKGIQIDLVHAHVVTPGGQIAQRIKEEYNIPYVITEHTSNLEKYFEGKELEGLIYRDASNIIVVGESQAKILKSNSINSVVIPNIIDGDFFKPLSIEKENKTFSFFSLGHLIDRKNFNNLLIAFSKVAEKNPDSTLKIGGTGPNENQLKITAKELKIDDKVIWLGNINREEVVLELQHSNAFVLASRKESFGIVYMEAIACGKPVVATVCGGPEQFVTDECGVLVQDPEDVNELAEAMLSVINNFDNYSEQAIRSYFDREYAKQKIAEKHNIVFKKAIV